MPPVQPHLLLRSIRKSLVAEEDRRCPDRQLLQRFARDGDGDAFLAGHDHSVLGLAFSPDGRVLISCGGFDRTVRCWNVAARKQRWCFRADLGETLAVAHASDGKSVAVGTSQSGYLLLDAATGRKVRTIPAMLRRPDGFPSICFSPDGRTLATAANDTTLRLWDVATGKEVRSFRGHLEGINAVLFAPDGKALFSASADGTALRWDLEARAAPVRPGPRRPFSARPPTVPALDVGRRIGPRYLQEHDGKVTALAIAPDGRTVASCGAHGRLVASVLTTSKPMFAVQAHRDRALAVAYSPDSKYLASGGADYVIRIWDPWRRRQVGMLKGHRHMVAALAFSPDGHTLASGDHDHVVCLWDLPHFTLRRRFTSGKGKITALSFAPDGKTLAVGGETTEDVGGANHIFMEHADLVRRWDVATGKELPGPKVQASVAAHAADGRSLLAAGDVLDIRMTPDGGQGINHKNLITLTRPGAEPLQLLGRGDTAALSPDGQLLASGGGWDMPSHELKTGMFGPPGPNSPLGVWDTATGSEVLRFGGLSITAVAFAPDGRTLVAGTDTGLVVAWDLLPAGRSPEPKDRGVLWDQLAERDAKRAYRAGCTLALGEPEAVRLLRARLRPAPPVDGKRVRRLLEQLEVTRFEEREAAFRELTALGSRIGPALDAALTRRPSAEARRRLEAIRKQLDQLPRTSEGLRIRRAIRVLEQAGSPEARRLLEELARGAPGALRTTEAKSALRRLDQQSPRR